ncbi:alginate export family protein [Pseudoalteromonas sp. C2R02]|uniref:alginate export family protein n=1 Tax=Pseudoalteromonas sp. C2R02 TaxID=2841565 RepID=UPI001C0961E2|nr:alginate export family protein [Pseudoalteromonas sp. C2R02]MBU2972666.1 alginate export family protein [Pseudoalteromonas sp. C2R02]
MPTHKYNQVLMILLTLILILPSCFYAHSENITEDKTDFKPPYIKKSNHSLYYGVKGFTYQKLQVLAQQRIHQDQINFFVGLKYNYLVAEDWLFDSDIKLVHRRNDNFNSEQDESFTFLEVKRFKLIKENFFGSLFWDLELGRDRLKSRASWLFDDEIDFIELNRNSTLLDINLFAAKWLWDARVGADLNTLSEEQKIETTGSKYLSGELNYQWFYNHYFQFNILHEDYINSRAFREEEFNLRTLVRESELTWFRAALHGSKKYNVSTDIDYWFDIATLSGERSIDDPRDDFKTIIKQKMSGGHAYRMGITTRFENNKYAFGIGYDLASSGEAITKKTELFIQPFIASNRSKIFGFSKRRIYGEVLAPQLSNLQVFHLGGGYAIDENQWLELSLYNYRQDEARSDTLLYRQNDLLSGASKDIGWEVDFSLGMRFPNELRVESVFAYLKAGRSFEYQYDKNGSYRISLNFVKDW